MDIRYVAWAGYQLDYPEGVEFIGSPYPPELDSEHKGDRDMSASSRGEKPDLSSRDMRPKLVAFPQPTV